MKIHYLLIIGLLLVSCDDDTKDVTPVSLDDAFEGVKDLDNSSGLKLVDEIAKEANNVTPYYFFKSLPEKRAFKIWEARKSNKEGLVQWEWTTRDSLAIGNTVSIAANKDLSFDDFQKYAVQAKSGSYKTADFAAYTSVDFKATFNDKELVQYDTINIKQEIVTFFSPENFECVLPKKIKKRFKKRKNWIPSSLKSNFNNLPDVAYKLNDASIAVLLNTFYIKPSDGSEKYPVTVTSSQTYSSFDVQKYIDGQRSNFAYSLDCSGYLSAAFSVDAKAPIVDIQSSAQSSLDRSNSTLLARAFVFSPIISAIRPRQFNKGNYMSDSERLDVLVSILSSVGNTNDDDVLMVPPIMDVLWTSKKGESKFNGEGKFTGNAGGGIGIASLSFKTSAGASFTRSTTFTDYDSYLLNSEIINNPRPIKIVEIKNEIKKLTKNTVITKPLSEVDGKKVFTVGIPASLCDLNWTIEESNFTILSTQSNEKGCEFEILAQNPNAPIATLKCIIEGVELKKKVLIQ
ncbi:hypothetical protein [uncultured Winogradskyella sp.]|uniref:hypothetical protein n=1 Tax=uncultured Winogradskyella sp. TaxID=395353 RepID=UPI00262735A2|nr:hypothetical protein [uncultured Winogradskyella sp.]